MAMARKSTSTRKPPEPSDDHTPIEDWMGRVMPDLNPLVTRLDELIRDTLPTPQQYALKWKKAYYGVPDQGWVIELVAYDVSVNVVFLNGAELDDPPPLGDGAGRYVKLKDVDEIDEAAFRRWVEQAATTPGWR